MKDESLNDIEKLLLETEAKISGYNVCKIEGKGSINQEDRRLFTLMTKVAEVLGKYLKKEVFPLAMKNKLKRSSGGEPLKMEDVPEPYKKFAQQTVLINSGLTNNSGRPSVLNVNFGVCGFHGENEINRGVIFIFTKLFRIELIKRSLYGDENARKEIDKNGGGYGMMSNPAVINYDISTDDLEKEFKIILEKLTKTLQTE